MFNKIFPKIFAFVLMAGLVFGAFQPAGAVEVASPTLAPEPQGPVQPDKPVSPGGEGVEPNPMAKLDNELRTLSEEGGDEAVLVYILAEPGADLSGVAEVSEVRPMLGKELVVANVTPNKISKMASHPDVLAAEVFHAIEAPSPFTPKEDIERLTPEKVRELREQDIANLEPREFPFESGAAPQGINAPEDWHGKDLIGAPEAWAKGYEGDGVNIAILDSGVDFGHPDLEDNIAFYDGGFYDGWPIALDPRSMRNYYYNGWDADRNYQNTGDYSWYADVGDVIYCTSGMTETFLFDGNYYDIAPEIVNMSLSGEIRWSVHPDIQLRDYVSPSVEWVPFLLIDANTAGDYDTVIADLNFDFWFDNYDDTAVLGTTDPVLNQDIGSYVYTDTVVMTGTHFVPSGLWFFPPLWWGMNTAGAEMTLGAGAFIYAKNHYSGPDATDGADGIAEVSGGMVYFIGDGKLPIPGMDYLYPGWGQGGRDPIPLNGQLAAFMLGSDYVDGYDHGTLCASAATAAGEITGYFSAFGEFVQYDPDDWSKFFNADDISEYLPWLKPGDEGTVQGPAPNANIIAMGANYDTVLGMQGFYDSYTFLASGVDGVPGNGDEFVDIVSMSYGDGSVHNDGWDWESRLLSYYNQNFLPNTTFFASSGNGGYGFGTINSPQGNTTVSVGASTQYGATDVFGNALSAAQINDGEVQPFSGRGPDAMGRPDPDVVATGAWGAGDTPLNMSAIYNLIMGGGWFPGDGNNAWYEWGGTSRSSPEAAGVMALVYDAYKQANGVFPDFETARQILMSGADDLNHDVLMQGAGRVNADRATDVAGALSGVYVEPSLLAAGEYMGTHYESFANVLFPGDTWDQTFTVNNSGAAAAAVTVGDEMLKEMQTLNYTQVVSPYLGTEGPYPATYYYYADYFVGANLATTSHGSDLVVPVPAGADFMEVQLTVPFEIFSFSYSDPDPYSFSYNADQRWSLTVFDWTDRNADGRLWEDTNADGVVSLVPGDLVDIAWTGNVTETEISRFAYSYNYANVQEVTVGLDGTEEIVIGLVHNNPNTTRPGWGSDEYQDNPLEVKVVFYEKTDWPLVTESTASLNVPAGSSATFDATFTIPADQPTGLYEGAITVDDGAHKTIIPTTVNVAVPGDDLLFTLGGTTAAGTPYDNGRMFGGYTWSGVYEEGDWRFYYYDAETGFDQQYLYVRDQWGDMCDNMPTANETLVWGPNPGDQYSLLEPDKYGPYGMQYSGGTWDANGPQYGWGSSREGSWWHDGDGAPMPENRTWATLWDGLNQVQLRNILLSGKHNCGEGFEATTGVFGVGAPESGLVINSDELSGSFTLDAVSPVDGLIAFAEGFGQEEWFRNQDVPQGKHDERWPDDLMDGWVHTFEVTNTYGIDIETFGPWSSDIGLFLMYDSNGDGIFNVQDTKEWVADSWDHGPFQDIYYSGNILNAFKVQDGTYAVIMYGREIEPGDQFDLRLVTDGGEDLNVEGANTDNNFLLSVTPGETESLTVNWQVPESGTWYGYMWFGMPWEEEPQYNSMGPGIYVDVTINAGAVEFARSTKEVDQELVSISYDADDSVILTYLITLVNDGVEDTHVHLTDLLPEGVNYYEQWVQDPDDPQGDGWTYVVKVMYESGEIDYYWPGDECSGEYDNGDYVCWEGDVGPSTSGKVYIEFKVKVKQGFVGTITNKADLKIWDVAEFLPLYATTEVAYPIFLPLAPR